MQYETYLILGFSKSLQRYVVEALQDPTLLILAACAAVSLVVGLTTEVMRKICFSSSFLLPFSLQVNCLLRSLRGDNTTESPLLADSSFGWPSRPNPSFGPLSRNEIGLYSRLPISSSSRGISASLASSLEFKMEWMGVENGDKYHEADSSKRTSWLTQTSFIQGL